MRSPHNAQPSVNLGDDPDPAAELGHRAAAVAQAVQGLLTNYLFYGQRQAAATAQLERRAGGQEHTHGGLREQARREAAPGPDTLAQIRGGRADDPRDETERHRADERPGAQRPTMVPTLRLVEATAADPPSGRGLSNPASDLTRDGLSADITRDDALAQDGLAAAPQAEPPGTRPSVSR